MSRSRSETAEHAEDVRPVRADRRRFAVLGSVVLALALQGVRALTWVHGGGSMAGAVTGVLASVVVLAAALAYAGLSTSRVDHLAVVALGVTTVGAPWLTLRAAGVGGAVLVALSLAGVTLACLGARRHDRTRQPLLVAGSFVGLTGACLALVGPGRWSVELPAESAAQAAGEVVMGTALRLPAAWACAALLALGAVRVLVLRRAGSRAGVVGLLVLVVVGVLYVGASSPGLAVIGAGGFPAYPVAAAVAGVLTVPWVLVSSQGSLLLAEELDRVRVHAVRVGATVLILVALVALGSRGLVAALLGGAGL